MKWEKILRAFGSCVLSVANKFERLYQAEGLPKNISIEEFLDEPSGKAERCTKHGVLCKQSD